MKKRKQLIGGFITFCCAVLFYVPAFAGKTITLMTHDSFNISKDVIAAFEKQNNATVRILKSGDAGTALVQAILSKDNPMADVFFGIDNTFLSRALEADIFLPYDSPQLATVPRHLQLDSRHTLLPVTYGDVCLNYDKKWFAEKKLTPPADLADLVKPEYKGLLVVENPATSSPGLAFLLATIGRFGEKGYLDFWKQLRANDVLVANGWEDAYFGHFSGGSKKGTRPLVVSYATSPPAAVYYAEGALKDAPTTAVVTPNTAFQQIEFVGILKKTKEPALAKKLVDFMLGKTFQEDIPLQMFMFPTNQQAKLPELFVKYGKIAEKPAVVAPKSIEKNRNQWIDAWTTAVLR